MPQPNRTIPSKCGTPNDILNSHGQRCPPKKRRDYPILNYMGCPIALMKATAPTSQPNAASYVSSAYLRLIGNVGLFGTVRAFVVSIESALEQNPPLNLITTSQERACCAYYLEVATSINTGVSERNLRLTFVLYSIFLSIDFGVDSSLGSAQTCIDICLYLV